MSTSELCPCGNTKAYSDCCAPLHQGETFATTAEQLMRSRYSAFSRGQIDYLVATLHPSVRELSDRTSLVETVKNCEWLKLDVLKTSGGSGDETEGEVEFVAFYREEGIKFLREKSRFIKENGHWYYINGKTIKHSLPGRNSPCWCGSGKKRKKCHADAE